MKVSNKIYTKPPAGYISEEAARHILGDMELSDFLLVVERSVDVVWAKGAPYYREKDVKSAQVGVLASIMQELFGGSGE